MTDHVGQPANPQVTPGLMAPQPDVCRGPVGKAPRMLEPGAVDRPSPTTPSCPESLGEGSPVVLGGRSSCAPSSLPTSPCSLPHLRSLSKGLAMCLPEMAATPATALGPQAHPPAHAFVPQGLGSSCPSFPQHL